MEDLEVKVERVEQRSKSNTHQIEELKEEMKEMKEENKAIYDIACSVKVMAERLGNIEDKVDETAEGLKRTEAKLGQIENAPTEKTAGNLENCCYYSSMHWRGCFNSNRSIKINFWRII